MAHTHDVYDMENHFEINGSSRFIKETSETKLVVVQGDHKSEVLTFKMPRYIDGHDMTLCNKIRIHYINLDTKTNNKSADVYEVTDLTLCEECEDVLTFTWTIEAPATKYSGTLSFLVKFECTEGENVLYQWNTAKYVSVNVLAGIDNSEEFVEKYSNVLEEWYNELTKGADSIEELNQQAIAEIELAKEDAKEDIQGKANSTMAEMNQFSSNAYNSFKNDVDTKAQQTLESIPEEYTDLDVDVKDLKSHMYRDREVKNLYNKSIAQDKKDVANYMQRYPRLDDSENTAFSGIVHIDKGTYTIYQGVRPIGNLYFSDENDKGVCAVKPNGSAVGGGSYYWVTIDNKVEISVINENTITFTVLDDAIKGISWLMHGTSLWKNHTTEDFESLISTAMMVQGTEIPSEYIPYGKLNVLNELEEKVEDIEKKISNEETTTEKDNIVVCFKNGNDYQMRMPLEGKVYCAPIKDKISANNTMDFLGQGLYLSADIKSTEEITASSAYAFKNWTDDICPVHYNNENRCGGHAISGAYNITCANHGLTEADIGSLWNAYVESLSDTVTYVIISIIDENTILIVSDDTGNRKTPVRKGVPTSPLVHVSGATNTTDIPFNETTYRYVTPSCNGQTFFVKSAEGKLLEEDGLLISEKYIDVVESYYSLNYQEMIAYLKSNVGNNKNDTYYNDERKRELFFQSTYRFFPSACCLTSFAITPLIENTYVDYWGGIQCTGLGNIKFIPYTKDYKEPTSYTEKIVLPPETWENEDFPPYKFFEISEENNAYAFGVGYVLDYGQTTPEARKNVKIACTINYPGNKMYPNVYYEATSSDIESFGKSYCGYAWKAPMIVKDNRIMTWYAIGEEIYIEVEFLDDYNGYLVLPDVCEFKRIEVLKKTDTVTMPIETVSDGGIYCISNGVGSLTLKCY